MIAMVRLRREAGATTAEQRHLAFLAGLSLASG